MNISNWSTFTNIELERMIRCTRPTGAQAEEALAVLLPRFDALIDCEARACAAEDALEQLRWHLDKVRDALEEATNGDNS